MASEPVSRLKQVGEDRVVPAAEERDNGAALQLLLLSLKSLSQKTIVALSSLFTLATVFSVWWLFDNDLPADPSTRQLVGLGLYGTFVLLVHWMRRV